MSAMGVALRPLVEEARVLKEKLAQQVSTARQDREKLLKEVDRHKKRANDADQKLEEARKRRKVAENKIALLEKQQAELKVQLEGKTEAARIAEEELARLAEQKAADMEEARKQAVDEFLDTEVQPALDGMKERAWKKGFQKGFDHAKALAMASYPDLAEELNELVFTFEGDSQPDQTAGGGQPTPDQAEGDAQSVGDVEMQSFDQAIEQTEKEPGAENIGGPEETLEKTAEVEVTGEDVDPLADKEVTPIDGEKSTEDNPGDV